MDDVEVGEELPLGPSEFGLGVGCEIRGGHLPYGLPSGRGTCRKSGLDF